MAKSKKALISGGTRGIGKAIALELVLHAGVGVLFLNYVENETAALQARDLLEAEGCKVHLLKYNMAFPAEISAMFDEINGLTDQLDFYVHSTALTSFKPLHLVKPNQWDLTLNISAKSFLQCAQGCVPLMHEGGKMLAISSTGSRRFNPNYGALGVAKSTLESMVQYLAVELADKNIQVNGIVAGMIQGEKLPPFPNIDKVVEETLRRTPARRLGTPADVAKTALFLLTQADWMYGQNVVLDGGYCLT
ncbi:MAG: SDR family oxidoreductase [Saprospiraceae bacterium]|nr:SDR family oxidoreductase [Saprospiraceae bacterium]